jgi:hypothetical protein
MRFAPFLLGYLAALLPAIGVAADSVPRASEGPACGYFVAPMGSDDADGKSAATAFATVAKAQSAARDGRSKVVCLRAGIYKIASTVSLTSADSGETWRYYAPDGVDSAVLEGGNTLSGFFSIGGDNITIDGLTMQHFYDSAVKDVGGHTNVLRNITIENCNVGFNVETGIGKWSEAIALGNMTSVQILNNYVHDVQSQGIGLFAYDSGSVISGVVRSNVVLNTVQSVPDGGAIYINMKNSGTHGIPAGSSLVITNNYVADYGNASSFTSTQGARGIYLDDNSSNVVVSGNVIGPANRALNSSNDGLTAAIFVHNGSGNVIENNIIDLGSSGNEAAVDWGYDRDSLSGMAGSVFKNNIVVSSYTGAMNAKPSGSAVYFQDSRLPASDFTIQGNLYYGYAGGRVSTSGTVVGDSNPIVANPLLRGHAYQLASNSPAFISPMNFTPIVGGWGPPGFAIPVTGVPPSYLH